jgi:hypothetical protein
MWRGLWFGFNGPVIEHYNILMWQIARGTYALTGRRNAIE